MTSNTTTSSRRARFRGERGVAVIMTALCLLPLMAFAAFGVDLASFYSRASYLQKSADAAALAGTVWMPNLTKARQIACDSLLNNGIDGGDCGTGPFGVSIDPGSTANSLLVTVTDPAATRYFSQVFGNNNQALTRTAEAEYNLPLPLGSPLNYFGGDTDRTDTGPGTTTYDVVWPIPHNDTSRPPAVGQTYRCNVGTSAAEGLGGWRSATDYRSGDFNSANPRCTWTVLGTNASGTSAVPPPDYTTRTPTNPACRVWSDGTTSGTLLGRWGGSPATFSTPGGTTGAPCTWTNRATDMASVPNFYDNSNMPPGSVPTNRPCRVGYEASLGWHGPGATDGWTDVGVLLGGAAASGNRLCRWPAAVQSTFVPPPPNPIDPNRSPGFWGVIRGPGDVTDLGDAFSVRCRVNQNCGSTSNLAHRTTGYWYVIKMPASGATNTTIRLFDAAYNDSINASSGAGPAADQGGNFSSGNGFTTTYQLFEQNNPLDFTDRTAVGSCPSLSVQAQTSYAMTWTDLCTITPSNGDIYLLNVTTSGSSGNLAGANGYALEAVAAGAPDGPQQPAVYAYADMAMRTQKDGNDNASFYLAEVGPEHAGKTLVVQLFDAGDFTGSATVRPLMPKTGVAPGLTWTSVSSSDCSYTSTPAPNDQAGTDLTQRTTTSPAISTPTAPTLPNCEIVTQSGSGNSTRRFNDTWLTIRIDVPTNYTCTTGVNPELVAGSCWWGVRYDYTAGAGETTTWRARVEGNPVHLTQ